MWVPNKISLFVRLFLVIGTPNFHRSSHWGKQQMLVAAIERQSQTPYYFFYQHPQYPRDCYEALRGCPSYTNSSGVYVIKPDGYPEPFEVYCDNSLDTSGWTIIQRNFEGQIRFNRSWEDYRLGFGFLSTDMWIGNDKLSFITNQNRYQLRIDMKTTDDSSYYVTYDEFRISDVFSNYKLVTTGSQGGNIGTFDWCPTNKIYDECKCEGSCADPNRCVNSCSESHSCICPQALGYLMNGDDCIRRENCGCYISNTEGHQGVLLTEGQLYISPTCDRNCSCIDGLLTCDDSYRCDINADCEERNSQRQCYCREGYVGDGEECTRQITTAKDCKQLYDNGERTNKIYQIKPTNWSGSPFDVYCNMSDGGGWTVFQRRVDDSEDFNLFWDDYKNGFGDLDKNFWMGNDKLHSLTNQGRYELRIDFVNQNGDSYFAKYDSFRITDEADKYRLNLGSYTAGDAGDSLTNHNDQQFTTQDEDNDDFDPSFYSSEVDNLARSHDGAWWYDADRYGCTYCYCRLEDCSYGYSSLNAPHGGCYVYWGRLPGCNYEIQYTEMKVRSVE